MTSMTECALAM